MLDFSFEIVDESRIHIEYRYGSALFTFNLYCADGVWTIHPFDGILLRNREMCRLVIAELLRNKDMHVMLARENITLSELRTSINLQDADDGRLQGSGQNRREREQDPLDDYIASHSFEEIVANEQAILEDRLQLFKDIIERMFMEGYGPDDEEFSKVQSMIRVYKEAIERMSSLNGPDLRSDNRRRW
ncbi:hypothetical protein [Paenibacillus xylaniclasticus]|uniref:hypothetical protein n=1 Tax=Paenibacillus xylaniclasticus TaxID=588083 RepID=UPI000FD79D50|nr:MULTISPECIES: hypothetical protein [Paenibacillus]GFN31547.1 hypothetical protein PCURB6_18070 [Paenibacillus curdlanolyticus]